MSGHVVRSFDRVHKGLVLRDDAIESRFHIDSNIWVSVLVDRQTRRGVLQKYMQEPNLNLIDRWDRREDLVGNQVEAATVGADADCFLGPKHAKILASSLIANS